MTVSTANTSIKLDVHSPKKDAVVATGAPIPTATEVAIWAGANINPALVQSITGTVNVLKASALTKMPTAVVQVALGGGSGAVVADGTPDADSVMLYVGSDVVAKQQSHFLDRTVKRLIEAWLEA